MPTLSRANVVALLLLAAVLLPGATSAASHPAVRQFVRQEARDPLPRQPEPEPAAGPAPIVATSVATPAPAPPPAPPPPFLERAQVIALYGHPGVPVMGALGKYAPHDAAREAARVAAEYEELNGDRVAVPALHLITAVAQPVPMGDGTYLERLPDEVISAYVEAAREAGALLILDVQVGWADPLAEVQRLERFLAEPFVHLALDPEFATRGKGAPGRFIGTLDAEAVNRVQRYLAGLVQREALPAKIMLLHQFTPYMLAGTEAFENLPEVERVIDMDGYGSPGAKLAGYDLYALAPYSQRPAIKLFYEWDKPLLTPSELMALPRPPAVVIYQ